MIPVQGKVAGGLEVHGIKANLVTGLELAELPKIRLDHRHRAHKPAQAWPVRPQDHRHVPGEIHRADGIGVVMDIRRMQPCFTAIRACPKRLRPDQPDTGAAGVEMHFPLRGEEGVDVRRQEVFRRAVGAINHPQCADLRQRFSD